MLKRLSAVLILSVFSATFLAGGCVRSGDPASPPANPGLTSPSHSTAGTNNLLWGIFRVSIDPATGDVEILPLRTPQFTCNVTNFLQPPASPVQLLGIVLDPGECDLEAGYVECDVTLKHPFPWQREYRGFDVRGIVMGDGSLSLEYDPSVVYASSDDLSLLNADGFTRWWNATEFDSFGTLFGYQKGAFATKNYLPSATLNAYKYFADELGPNEPFVIDPANRGTFATTPGVNTRRYALQFPLVDGKPRFTFAYAVDASWASPDPSGDPYYPLESFPPEANCAEPYRIAVTDSGSSAWYVNGELNGGSLVLDIEVFDWQASGNPDGVAGEISGLWLESDILHAPTNVLDSATVIPTGPVSAIFRMEITDLDLTHAGPYGLWVIAESADPDTYEPVIPHPTSPYTWPAAHLAAYANTAIEVGSIQPQIAPTVLSISPDKATMNSFVPACIIGSHFASGCSVELRESGGIEPFVVPAQDESVNSEGTKIMCSIDLSGAPIGLYDVAVVNPDDLEGSLDEGFEISSEGYIIFVDSSNASGIESGTLLYPYKKIQTAVNAALDGCSIWVDDSGVPYCEKVVMRPGVDIISVNWDADDGDEEASITPPTGFDRCVVAADDSRIQGFEIYGVNGLWHARYGIVCDGASPDIIDSRVHGFLFLDACGINIVNGSHPHLKRVTIYDINNNTFNVSSSFHGINIDNCPAGPSGGVVIEHTVVHDVYSSGFYDGMNCKPHGINIKNSDGVKISNTIIYSIRGGYNNDVSGIRIDGSDDIRLHNIVVFDIYMTYNYGNAFGLYIVNSSNLHARNMIIYYVRKSLSEAKAYGVAQSGSTYSFDYSDVSFCSTALYKNFIPGDHCISLDPQFLDLGAKNFRLRVTSPCVNTGDPVLKDPDGTVSDMGAYGGPSGLW